MPRERSPWQPDALLLVGHGTRDRLGTEQFFTLATLLREKLAPVDVEGCLLEFQHPTIAEGWQRLIERGARSISVAPLLLFAAGHARRDIPETIQQCANETRGRGIDARYYHGGPLSRCPQIVELLKQRISATLDGSPPDPDTALVMVGRGSYDSCATTDMRLLAEIVAHQAGFQSRAVGFYAMAEPRLPDVLDRAATEPGIRRVVVQPHLLFQGRLYDAICNQVDEARARHPQVIFDVGDYLGPTAAVADALAYRAIGSLKGKPCRA
ncbi:sirohydrochlorin chelatase [Roseiconus lacunae]|uniref:sirohydrochlorin chelatase n=1 Tax=Roseiconus lacunae TaxID=2605694 RepID=UPI003092D694|nr:sirohydrochlorin chelatase [Stieleria sp. HD01]